MFQLKRVSSNGTGKGFLLCVSLAVAVMSITSCSKSNSDSVYDKIKPKGPKPAWGPTITPQMQTVIEKLASYGTPPLYTLSPADARKAPSPADAAMAVMKDYNIPAPAMNVDTTGKDIPVTGGQIHLRIYTPKTGKSVYPVIVYYHGGGWVIANLDTYNASAQALAEQSEAVLISVAYRQAPEFKYPTAHNDSYAAYVWALQNAASIKGDPKRVAVAGESAGGNLAAAVSIMARGRGVMLPVHEVLVYPIANYDFTSASYVKYDSAKPLNRPLMQWFFNNYLPTPAAGKDSLISLVNANLKGLPPTTIIAAEIDPLQSEGQTLYNNMLTAGVTASYQKYIGVTHEFFGMATVIPEAKQAQAYAAVQLLKAFNK